MKKVEIKWIDALSNDGWFTKEDAIKWANDDKGLIIDIGFLVHKTKDWVLISPSYSEITEQHGYLKKIPKAQIISIK